MNFLKYALIAIGALILLGLAAGSYIYSGAKDDFQHDMDIVRLNDLQKLGGLVEEFRKKTGRYPLAGRANVPNYVHIASKNQKKYTGNKPKYAHEVTALPVFLDELERGLGRKVNLGFDPQQVTRSRPNFYVYMVDKGRYFLAVHLYNDYPFARKIAENYSKAEISSKPEPKVKITTYERLMADPEFIKAVKTPLLKPGYIKRLQERQRAKNAL